MSHCRDCEFFVDGEAALRRGDTDPERWRTCALTDMNGAVPLGFGGGGQWPVSLAIAEDASGYHAVLCVAPDFGCVQFKEAGVRSTETPPE